MRSKAKTKRGRQSKGDKLPRRDTATRAKAADHSGLSAADLQKLELLKSEHRQATNQVLCLQIDEAKRRTAEIIANGPKTYGEAKRRADEAANGNVIWSRPRKPTEWRDIFKCCHTSLMTMFAKQTIRNKKLGAKSYQVDVRDLPAGVAP